MFASGKADKASLGGLGMVRSVVADEERCVDSWIG